MASGLNTFTKDPAEKLDYTIDWSEELTDVADSISSSAWTVESGITQEAVSAAAQSTKIWLSGGTAETSYTITNRITTVNNPSRIYQESFVVTVSTKE